MIKYSDQYWDDIEKVIKYIPKLESIYQRSIVITGATGMICSSVADILLYLNQKYNADIRVILAGRSLERIRKRFGGFEPDRDFYFLEYDATKERELEVEADYMVHGASNASPAVYAAQPVETMLANMVGLNSLLSMAAKQKSRRLLYISSSEVYGNKEGREPYREEDYGFVDILNPRASYPSSKRAAETLCVAYGQEYGLDTVIVRPGHIYGPTITDSDSRASAQFTRNAARGEDIVMKSAGMQLRSYCYTLDCASAILTVLINGEAGSAYNISNKDSVVTISELADAIARAADRKVVYMEPSDQEKKGYNLMSNSSLDAEKLECLGWKAVFDLEQGTKRTLELFEDIVN